MGILKTGAGDYANKMPDQEELEKELSEYLSKKYGYRIKVVSPMLASQQKESTEGPKSGDFGYSL